MPVVEIVLIALVVAFVVALVAWPLRAGAPAEAAEDLERASLEVAKEAKYREIRDAEMDFRTGKLSDPDYRALDRSLRAEAVEILRELDERTG